MNHNSTEDTVRAPGCDTQSSSLGAVYLIGIGGVGMSALARLLLNRGLTVAGSELEQWPVLKELRQLGATVYTSHLPENLDNIDTVVFSTAIPRDHVELAEAKKRGLRVLHRSEALSAAMVDNRIVAVAGTHGKTTTASMTTFVLQEHGADPSYVIGGEISHGLSNAYAGDGTYFIVEADESDKSFLNYEPFAAVVTNIGDDHLSSYGDTESIYQTFVAFSRRISERGFLVTCGDDSEAHKLSLLAKKENRRVFTYGESDACDFQISNVVSSARDISYDAVLDGKLLGNLTIPAHGYHTVLNSAASALMCLRLGVSFNELKRALSRYPGVKRRLEYKGTSDGIHIYDEYSFHPRSVTVALEALRDVAGDKQLIVVFQPLRMARTNQFRSGLAEALAIADQVLIMNVCDPDLPVTEGRGALELLQEIPLESANKVFTPSEQDVYKAVNQRTSTGDVVVTLGAPPIGLLADKLLNASEYGNYA